MNKFVYLVYTTENGNLELYAAYDTLEKAVEHQQNYADKRYINIRVVE